MTKSNPDKNLVDQVLELFEKLSPEEKEKFNDYLNEKIRESHIKHPEKTINRKT